MGEELLSSNSEEEDGGGAPRRQRGATAAIGPAGEVAAADGLSASEGGSLGPELLLLGRRGEAG